MNKILKNKFKIISKSIFLIALFALSLHSIASWNPPSQNPTSGNVEEPINVSTNTQTKNGILSINATLFASGLEVITGITKMNGLTYQWPASQGTGNKVLQNNAGTLTWVTPASGGTPGGADTLLQYNNNGAFGGITGATTNGTTVTLNSPIIANIAPGADFTLTQNSVAPFKSKNTGAVTNTLVLDTGKVGIGDSTPLSALTVGSGDKFQVDSTGDLIKINGVTYAWPSTQSSGANFLKNDGSGTLSWAAAGGGSSLDLSWDSLNHQVDISGGGTSATIPLSLADGATKGISSYTSNDFDANSGNISIDYANGQSSSGTTKGFLASGDWTTFSNKLSSSLASGNIFVGNGATPSIATSVAMSGDATLSSAGALTINNDAVSYAKLQNVAANSFLANTTAAPGDVNAIATNRIPLFPTTITGTPSSSNYLRGDGSWNTPTATQGNLTGDVTSVGLATTYAGTVPMDKGGTGKSLYSSPAAIIIKGLSGTAYDVAQVVAGPSLGQSIYYTGGAFSAYDVVKLDGAQTFTGTKTFPATTIFSSLATTGSAANTFYDTTSSTFKRFSSSKRYKKDILDLDIDTSNIYNLRPVSYNSISDNTRHFGLIAEEVASIIPELAEYSREKDVIKGSTSEKLIPESVQYALLPVLLLKEVKKHEEKLKVQEKVIEDLKARLDALEAKNK